MRRDMAFIVNVKFHKKMAEIKIKKCKQYV